MKRILFAFLCCLILCSCNSNEDNVIKNHNNKPDTIQSNAESSSDNKETQNNEYKVDVPFVFDDLEITISSDYTFSKINNTYSEYNNKAVVRIPVTIKNLKNETHSLNMFYYSLYGSKGIELGTVASYFDDSIDYSGKLKTGASQTKYFYLLYDGDGIYSIEFDDWVQKINIDINVVK